MKIHIPNSAFLGNINTFIGKIDTKNEDILEITTHPKWISLHPLVLAMTAALGKKVAPQNIHCEEITAKSGHYLVRMKLFEILGIKPKVKNSQEHAPEGLLIPLRQIKDSKDQKVFIEDLVPLLHMQDNPKQVEAIQHIFSELIRNVLEHSNSPEGAMVCAQYFKKGNRISIGVADTGIGLKQSLKRSYGVKDDKMALQLALTPGVTGTTVRPGGTAQNAGFGLFLIKSIAFINSTFFTIISGKKMYKLLRPKKTKITRLSGNPFVDRHSLFDVPHWDGVAVGVDISLDQNKKFSDLLKLIYGFYSREVKDQKKAKYKKPKFI